MTKIIILVYPYRKLYGTTFRRLLHPPCRKTLEFIVPSSHPAEDLAGAGESNHHQPLTCCRTYPRCLNHGLNGLLGLHGFFLKSSTAFSSFLIWLLRATFILEPNSRTAYFISVLYNISLLNSFSAHC